MDQHVCVRYALSAPGGLCGQVTSGFAEVQKENINCADQPLSSNFNLRSYKTFLLGKRKQSYRMF